MTHLQPVLLSGGAGTRLWPLSRQNHPKQFLTLPGDMCSLLQNTWLRISPLALPHPIVVANETHRFLAAEQLRSVGLEGVPLILEPVGRNTAPAIALAALQAMESGADPVLLVLPTDHVIDDGDAFRSAVLAAADAAAAGALVTFGVVPRAPDTGYGYLQASPDAEENGLHRILRFIEKPDRDTAVHCIEAGHHFWNSGMFMFRASRYLDTLARHRPEIAGAMRTAFSSRTRDGDFIRPQAEAFLACPSDSIDYAVMEHTRDGFVLPVEMGWNDAGSWHALWDISSRDRDGNAFHGDVVALDSHDNYVHTCRRVALLGVDDLVVADTGDAVLIAGKDDTRRVGEIVAQARRDHEDLVLSHPRVHRPWGSYECIAADEGFQVKRIRVRPGGKLSLQTHAHRAEHWVVVRGTARVTRGEAVFELHANQSAYIPTGIAHRLENPGTEPLELIEVQSGDYLGEDDIVRHDDAYGRT